MIRGLGLALVLSGCARAPSKALTWRESWEVLALPEDLGVLDLRATVGNTGLLRGQGHIRLDHCLPATTPQQDGHDEAPANVAISPAHDAAQVGLDYVRAESPGVWAAQISGPEGTTRFQVSAAGEGLKPTSWQEGGGQWALSAPVIDGALAGWAEAGERGGLLRGHAVVLHRGGDGLPRGGRLTAVVLGREISAGLDAQGAGQQTWARLAGASLDVSNARFSWKEDGKATLDFRPAADLWISLKHPTADCEREPDDHLFRAERLLAGLAGIGDTLRWERYEAEVHAGAVTTVATAVVVASGARAEGEKAPRAARRAP